MNKSFWAGVSALSLAVPGLIASVAVIPAASASTSADIDSTATMEEQCRWVLLGAPTGLSLATDGTEYVGDALEMSAAVSQISAHSTGNDDSSPSFASFTDCTFFGDVFRPTVTVTLSDADFTAEYNDGSTDIADNGMDFDLDDSAFSLDLSTGTCDPIWTTDKDIDFTNSSLSSILLEIREITDVTSRVEDDGTGAGNDLCGLSGTASVSIPAGKTPDGPGKLYTFTGPSLTTALSTSTSGAGS